MIARRRSEFADLLRRQEPTPADLLSAVWSHYQGQLEQDQAARAGIPAATEIGTAEINADERGFFSGEPSTFFNSYFHAIGVKCS